MPTPAEAFSPCLVGSIAESMLALLRDDDAVSGFFATLADYELEDFLTSVDDVKLPALGLIIDGFERKRDGSNRLGRLDTVLMLAMVFPKSAARGTDGYLQARVCEHIVQIVEEQKGILFDAQDPAEPLTEALLTVQRVPGGVRVPGKSAVIKRLKLLFTSSIHIETGDFLP